MQKVTPFLWFDRQAEDAARFYVSVFRDGSVGKPTVGPDGKVLVVPFHIQGQEFSALTTGKSSSPAAERNRCAAG
jgi:predicted 3-demethylubiquinone-9 3-methyltransferase (glyoxalase superfamily)